MERTRPKPKAKRSGVGGVGSLLGESGIKDVKESKGGGGGDFLIQNIPTGETQIQFVTEPTEWAGYHEWWDAGIKRFVPLGEGEPRPKGTSRRFLASAVILDTTADWSPEPGKVVALKLPATVATKLISRYERYGTLVTHQFTLVRQGEGLDVEYDVDTGDKVRALKLKGLDLLGVLGEVWAEAHGVDLDDDEDDDEDEAPKPRARRKPKPHPEEEEFEQLLFDDDDEEEDEEEDDEEDEVEWTEEALKGESIRELRAIADDLELAHKHLKTKADLIELILEGPEDAY